VPAIDLPPGPIDNDVLAERVRTEIPSPPFNNKRQAMLNHISLYFGCKF